MDMLFAIMACSSVNGCQMRSPCACVDHWPQYLRTIPLFTIHVELATETCGLLQTTTIVHHHPSNAQMPLNDIVQLHHSNAEMPLNDIVQLHRSNAQMPLNQ